ncbi:MAG: serine/threonine-protein kinase [bacterium]
MSQPILICRACDFMSSCALLGDQCPSDHSLLLPRATLDAAARDPFVGRVLGRRYLLLEAPDPDGAVPLYRGFDLTAREPVSVKLLRVDGAAGAERFAREGRALRRVAHPTLPRVRAMGTEPGGLAWMAFEAIAGQPLRRVIAEQRISPNRAINITLRILAALDRLHAAGLVHGDLCPGAVWVVPGGLRNNDEIKLVDCGAAAPPEEAITSADSGLGPGYRAPEQFTGGAPGLASDLYATGLLLYEMLTGHPPFEGGLSFERMLHHCRLPVPPLELAPEFARLEEVVYQALDKSPAARWRQARSMALALKAAFVTRGGERVAQTSAPPVAAPAPTDSQPPRRPPRLSKTALSLVAAALGGLPA